MLGDVWLVGWKLRKVSVVNLKRYSRWLVLESNVLFVLLKRRPVVASSLSLWLASSAPASSPAVCPTAAATALC